MGRGGSQSPITTILKTGSAEAGVKDMDGRWMNDFHY